MSSLQPLYDVKERLEYAAVAGTSLLEEDFRLQRAAESMRPLAEASPVFAKISAGLEQLLAAQGAERPGLLLDVLGLVDAVAYTQGKYGLDGALEDLPAGGGAYRQISCSQIRPLLTALTTTGGGRMEVIQSAWENNPRFFSDFRVLPAVVAGLGDSYGEIAELNANILKEVRPSAVPLLKKGFDPAGKREMARRVEVIAAVEGAAAAPWLKEILPLSKKEVRPEVIRALGAGPENAPLLLDLAKTERGKNREAVLEALARMDGGEVQKFWEAELAKNSGAVSPLQYSRADWAAALVAGGLMHRLEHLMDRGGKVETKESNELGAWLASMYNKDGPAALAFWRWTDQRLEDIKKLKNNISQPLRFEEQLSNFLLHCLSQTQSRSLCELCTGLYERDRERVFWFPHAFLAAALTESPEAVYEAFSPCLLTKKPLLDNGTKRSRHEALLRILLRLSQQRTDKISLDRRWVPRLADAVWKDMPGKQTWYAALDGMGVVGSFETTLLGLMDPEDPEHREAASTWFLERMASAADWYIYGRLVLRCGGNPRSRLRECLSRSVKSIYLYHVWTFCNEAAGKVSGEDLADMLDAFLTSGRFRKEDEALAASAIPYTQELLKAGRPFPEWDDWWRMK